MTNHTHATTGVTTPAQAASPSTAQLRETIHLIDSLVQGELSEIAAIAKVAMLSLETPDGQRHTGNLAHVLRAIWSKADQLENDINVEAERVGCNFTDAAETRRNRASVEARKCGAA